MSAPERSVLDLPEGVRHCDDYIPDKTQPKCLRKFLLYHRIPADWRFYRWKDSWGEPVLYATWRQARGPGGGKGKTRRVRVTMASRFGDVGITPILTAEAGYRWRVAVGDLTDFSEEP